MSKLAALAAKKNGGPMLASLETAFPGAVLVPEAPDYGYVIAEGSSLPEGFTVAAKAEPCQSEFCFGIPHVTRHRRPGGQPDCAWSAVKRGWIEASVDYEWINNRSKPTTKASTPNGIIMVGGPMNTQLWKRAHSMRAKDPVINDATGKEEYIARRIPVPVNEILYVIKFGESDEEHGNWTVVTEDSNENRRWPLGGVYTYNSKKDAYIFSTHMEPRDPETANHVDPVEEAPIPPKPASKLAGLKRTGTPGAGSPATSRLARLAQSNRAGRAVATGVEG